MQVIKQIADHLQSSDWSDNGFKYLIISSKKQSTESENQNIEETIKYINSKDLKAGVAFGCAAKADIEQFAKWGAKWIQIAACDKNDEKMLKTAIEIIEKQKQAIVTVLQYHNSGLQFDIEKHFQIVMPHGMAQIAEIQQNKSTVNHWYSYGTITSTSNKTDKQFRSELAIKALFSMPVLIETLPEEIQDSHKLSLLNDDFLRIQQDNLAATPTTIVENQNYQIWEKELTNNCFAFGITSKKKQKQTVEVDIQTLKKSGNYIIKEVWNESDIKKSDNVFAVDIEKYEIKLVLLTKQK